jgi:hypothetical protein
MFWSRSGKHFWKYNGDYMPNRTSKEYSAFVKLTDRILAVPRVEAQKRLAAHKEKAALNPRKRGPKPKTA